MILKQRGDVALRRRGGVAAGLLAALLAASGASGRAGAASEGLAPGATLTTPRPACAARAAPAGASAAERALWAALCETGEADLSGGAACAPEDDVWPDSRRVRAAFLETVLFDPPFAAARRAGRVNLRCVELVGRLDLSQRRLVDALALEQARLPAGIGLYGARLERSLSLRGSRLGADLDADGLRTEAEVFLQGARLDGAARFVGAEIGGAFEAGGAGFAQGLDLGGARFGGAVGLRRARISGGLRLADARLAAWADLSGAALDGDLDASRLETGGGLALTDGRLDGTVRLGRARLAGPLHADRVSVTGPLRAEKARLDGGSRFESAVLADGLGLAGARLGGDLTLDRARLGGPLVLSAARIEAGVSAEAAEIEGPALWSDLTIGGAARLDRARLMAGLDAAGLTARAFLLRAGAAEGPIDLSLAQIDGAADLTGAALDAPVLLPGARLGALMLDQTRFGPEAAFDLSNVDIGALEAPLAVWRWGEGGRARRADASRYVPRALAGARFGGGRLLAAPAGELVDWLEGGLARGGGEGRISAHRAMARALRDAGRRAAANDLLYAEKRWRASFRELGWVERAWTVLSDAVAGYGHHPARALAWMAALIALGAAVAALSPGLSPLGFAALLRLSAENALPIPPGGRAAARLAAPGPAWASFFFAQRLLGAALLLTALFSALLAAQEIAGLA